MGTAGNVELKKLLADEGVKYAENFRYSILEISDLHDSQDKHSSERITLEGYPNVSHLRVKRKLDFKTE